MSATNNPNLAGGGDANSAGIVLAQDDVSKLLQNPGMLAQALDEMDQEDLEKFVSSLPGPVKRRLQALKKLQVDAVKVEADFYKQVHELECKFADKFQALHNKRKTIVNGDYEPTTVEADFPLIGAPALSKDLEKKASLQNGPGSGMDDKESGDAAANAAVKGIPDFWLTVFRHVEIIAEMIQEHDEPILKHLTDVDVKLSQPPNGIMGFTLIFHFSPNEYFSNLELTKEYTLKCDVDEEDPFEFDGPEIVACKGTKVDWKQGKNVTVKMIKKKQKHKQKGQTRFVTKEVKNDSFFNFFDPPVIPEGGADMMDDDTRDLLNADFEIGQILRDRIIPRAVLHYTGEAQDEAGYDEDEDEEFDDEEDLEDEEDDGQVA